MSTDLNGHGYGGCPSHTSTILYGTSYLRMCGVIFLEVLVRGVARRR